MANPPAIIKIVKDASTRKKYRDLASQKPTLLQFKRNFMILIKQALLNIKQRSKLFLQDPEMVPITLNPEIELEYTDK